MSRTSRAGESAIASQQMDDGWTVRPQQSLRTMIQIRGVTAEFRPAAERELTQRPETLDHRLFVFCHRSPHTASRLDAQ